MSIQYKKSNIEANNKDQQLLTCIFLDKQNAYILYNTIKETFDNNNVEYKASASTPWYQIETKDGGICIMVKE